MPNDVLLPCWFCGEICDDYITHRYAPLVTMMGFGPKSLCRTLGPRIQGRPLMGLGSLFPSLSFLFLHASFPLAPTRIPVSFA